MSGPPARQEATEGGGRTSPSLALAPTLALAILGALLTLGWRWRFAAMLAGDLDLHGPSAVAGALGTDAALWGLTAADLAVGAPPLVPPLYPLLLALLAPALGGDLVQAGLVVSLAAASLLPLVVVWLARSLGAGRPEAVLAGLLVGLSPDVLAWGQQVQPESLTALLLVGLGACLGRAHGSRRAVVGAVILGGLFPLLREHGLLLAPLAALGLVLARPGGWRAGLALVALASLLPVLGGWSVGWPPMSGSWSDRAGGALAALTSEDLGDLGFLRELRRPERDAYLALVADGDLLGRIGWHGRRSLGLAADVWALWAVVVATVLVSRARALWPTALLLSASLPALVIWSQRRHVSLLLVVLLPLLAAWLGPRVRRAASRLGAGSPLALLAVTLAVVGAITWSWPGRLASLGQAQLAETQHAAHLASLSASLCDLAGPGNLLGTRHQEVGLGCPLPRHDPDGSLADWRTWTVAESAPAAPGAWGRVDQGEGALGIWRLESQLSPRPCADAPLPSHSPHLAVERARVELVCTDVDPRSTPE